VIITPNPKSSSLATPEPRARKTLCSLAPKGNTHRVDQPDFFGATPSPLSANGYRDANDPKSLSPREIGVLTKGVLAFGSFVALEILDMQGRGAESAILRRKDDRWLLALLHSTRIEKPA
jgi:hypothetical protein